MGVVAAGVHHIHLLAMIGTPRGRGEWQARRLLDRQGIHIRAQGDGRARFATFENSDHSRAPDTRMDFGPSFSKVLGDQLGSACFLLAELWVLVDVPSPLDHLLLDLGSADKGLLLERVRLGMRGRQTTSLPGTMH